MLAKLTTIKHKNLGAVDIFQSGPLNVHWTFRSDLPPPSPPPPPPLNVNMEFQTNLVSQAATQLSMFKKVLFIIVSFNIHGRISVLGS